MSDDLEPVELGKLDDLSWMNRGACRGLGDLMFLSSGSTSRDRSWSRYEALHIAKAKEVCASCSVLALCEREAFAELSTDLYADSIMAGLDPRERITIRRRLRSERGDDLLADDGDEVAA